MSAISTELLDEWANDLKGPVSLTLLQELRSVEGDGAVIFPPTYADIGYNIDVLPDGTKVCTVDSVGSQANRMEPVFKQAPYAELVPQILIELNQKDGVTELRSLLDLAHRSADAVVNSSPTLSSIVAQAFMALRQKNDALPLCSVAPTSLVFGVWDSRGGSGEKRPRLIQSTIRAWNVDVLRSAAQFNSVWKLLTEEQKAALVAEAKTAKVKLSEKGFADAPVTYRKVNVKGMSDAERRVFGGIVVRGQIERRITINLVALRNLEASDFRRGKTLRLYLLVLALIAATAETDLFLRSGCQLQIPSEEDLWNIVPRRGTPTKIALPAESTLETLLTVGTEAVAELKTHWPEQLIHRFDINEARRSLKKKDEDESEEA